MSLSKALDPLLRTGSTQEDGKKMVPTLLKNVDWDVKHQHKQSICHSIIFSNFIIIEPQHEISNILSSVDSDEPLQPPFKLRNSKWCSVSSLTIIEYSSD